MTNLAGHARFASAERPAGGLTPDAGAQNPQVHVIQMRPDDAQWRAVIDQWLAGRSESTPFHRPAWLAAVERGTGQRSFFLLALNGTGQIAGLVPLSTIHSPIYGRSLVSSGFAVDGGILAERDDVAQALAEATWDIAQRLTCPSIELRGGTTLGGEWQSYGGQYLGFAKTLEKDQESQLLAVPRKHRAELRKGLDNDLTVEIGRSERLLDLHYRLYADSVHRLGTPVFPRGLFEAMLDEMGEDADIILISKDGTPLTTIFSVYHQDRCMPYWQGSIPQARAMRSNEIAYYQLMGHARERGYSIFDFGRSKVGTGPAAWKRSWGWPEAPLVYQSRVMDGFARRDINPLSDGNRSKVELWKKLPLSIATFLGPFIARGLG